MAASSQRDPLQRHRCQVSQHNHYSVTLNDGQTYTVKTPKHHTQHSEAEFEEHLLDVIKQTIANVVGGVIIKIIFKGRA